MAAAKVLIGYPHGGKVDGAFTKSLLDLQRFEDRCPSPDYTLLDIEHANGLYVSENRNFLVRIAQKAQADWLLQLDGDETFDPTLLRLLMRTAHPETRPIVCGLYANIGNVNEDGNGGITVVDMLLMEMEDGTYCNMALPSEVQPFEVPGACGAGILLTHLSVFTRLEYPWFVLPYIKPTGDEHFRFMNEDVAFGRLVRQAGYQIWCDPLAQATHWKTVPLSPSLLRTILSKGAAFKKSLDEAERAKAFSPQPLADSATGNGKQVSAPTAKRRK